MNALRDRVDALRASLAGATDFSPVLHAFFDLVETSELMDLGGPVRDADLEAVLSRVGAELASLERAALVEIMVIRVPELGLTHGMLNVGGRSGGFFYFPALDQGLASLTLPNGVTPMARFTLARVETDAPVVLKGNGTVH